MAGPTTGAYSTADAEPWPDHDWNGCAEHGGHHTAAQLRHRVLPLPDQSRYGPRPSNRERVDKLRQAATAGRT